MSHFKGTEIYFIKESIYSKPGLPTIGNTIGPSGIQVVKSVYHLMEEYDGFYEGKLIDYNNINLWDKFKIIFGVDVTERIKTDGKLILNYEYCGYTTFITPIDGFSRILPEWASKKYKLNVHTPFIFGKDPVKNINLYNNIQAVFYVENGINGVPTSFCKYNSKTKSIVYIKSNAEFLKALQDTRYIKYGVQ